MIKNIMENIGRKEAAENYAKLIDRRDELFEKRDELYRKGKKLSPEESEEIRDLTEKIQHYLFTKLSKKKPVEEKDPTAMLGLTGDNKEKIPLTSPDLIPSEEKKPE